MGDWKNHYIDLVSKKPGFIFAETDREISPQTIEMVRERLGAFEEIFVELGSGSGGHIIELATRNPQALCIGFELRFKRTYRTGEKAEQRGLKNVLMIRSNARNLASLLPPQSIDRIYINFPDPWDKKRWLKNRMVNLDFIESLPALLKPSGVFRYRTDHPGAFSDAAALIERSSKLKTIKFTNDLHASQFSDDSIPTEFEGLFLSQGLKINFLECAIVCSE